MRKNEVFLSKAHQPPQKTDGPRMSPRGDHATRNNDKGDQPSDGETSWTNTCPSRSGRGLCKINELGGGMVRPSSNHGTLWLPNDEADDDIT